MSELEQNQADQPQLLSPGFEWCLEPGQTNVKGLLEIFSASTCVSSMTIYVTGPGTLTLEWHWAGNLTLDGVTFQMKSSDGVITYGGGTAAWPVAAEDILRLTNNSPKPACLVINHTPCES